MIIIFYKLKIKKKNYEYNNLYFIDLNFIKRNSISFIKVNLKQYLKMIYDLKKDYNKIKSKINFFDYDIIIIGTGPSATVLNDFLKKEKILILEKRKFNKKFYQKNVNLKNFKNKKILKSFAVGGTSLDWSQVSSYYEENEINRSFNKSKKFTGQ